MTTEAIKYRREIKSFVCREGRLTPGQAKAMQELNHYVLPLTDYPNFDFEKIFGNNNPVVLEIGFGMGWSLLIQAQEQPHVNFLGVEVHRPGVGALLSGMLKQNLSNIRIVNDDAVALLKSHLPDACLAGVQIFFPDPWHKKRHHKRRLIQAPLVGLLAQKLKPEGFLHCATDWENYAEHMRDVLNQEPLLVNTSLTGDYIERPISRPMTKFEQRGLKLGHGIWDLYFTKKSNSC